MPQPFFHFAEHKIEYLERQNLNKTKSDYKIESKSDYKIESKIESTNNENNKLSK